VLASNHLTGLRPVENYVVLVDGIKRFHLAGWYCADTDVGPDGYYACRSNHLWTVDGVWVRSPAASRGLSCGLELVVDHTFPSLSILLETPPAVLITES
jgi:hypothetical protein